MLVLMDALGLKTPLAPLFQLSDVQFDTLIVELLVDDPLRLCRPVVKHSERCCHLNVICILQGVVRCAEWPFGAEL